MISQIDRLLNKYKACWQSDSSREHRKCLFVKKVFEPALPKEESLGQRILILDGESQPSFYSAFFRYKKKVLSFLEQSSFGDGEFYEFFPVIKAPVVLSSIQDMEFMVSTGALRLMFEFSSPYLLFIYIFFKETYKKIES